MAKKVLKQASHIGNIITSEPSKFPKMIDNTLDSSGTVQQSYELFKVDGTIKPTGITFKSDAEYSEWFKNESYKVLDEGVSYIMFRTLKKIK